MDPLRLRFKQSTLDNEMDPWPKLKDLYDRRWYKVEACENGDVWFRNNAGTIDAVRRGSTGVDFEFEEDDVDKVLEKYKL